MAAKKKLRRGRPPLPAGQDRASVLTLRLTAAERARIEQEARKTGQTLSEWVRARLGAGRDSS